MYHTEDTYPHDSDEIPSVVDEIAEINWDVLCVFHGCRWDAFNDEITDAKPVSTVNVPVKDWLADVLSVSQINHDELNILNGITHSVSTGVTPKGDQDSVVGDSLNDNYSVISMADSIQDRYSPTTTPQLLEGHASGFHPPLVVLFQQPAPPFIGNLSMRVGEDIDTLVEDIDTTGMTPHERMYAPVEQGHVSPEYARLAYRENLQLVWECTKELQRCFDSIVFTSTYGEHLGPNTWGRTNVENNQSMVVPFHHVTSNSPK